MRALFPVVLVGCIKAAPVPQAPTSVPVALVAPLSGTGESEEVDLVAAPDRVIDLFADEVRRRNLRPAPVDGSVWLEPFATRRGTDARVEVLRDQVPPDGLLLLVESTARFSSQINGRYRWTVDVDLSVVHGDHDANTRHLSVPVALVYYHEREAEALTEAAPVIAREVGAILDEWVVTGS